MPTVTLQFVMDPQVEPFVSAPESAGLFLDFDGTLSEIVDDPSAARPVEGVTELLAGLVQRLKLVSVVSGRSAHELLEWLGPDIEIWGLHGAERTAGGKVLVSEHALHFIDSMQQARDEARASLTDDGIFVEDKGVMIGLHYRKAPDQDAAEEKIEKVAERLAQTFGLVRASGKLVVELRPPVEFSKADVLRRRSRESSLRAAAFIGDDVVDLPAFDALDELAAEGLTTLRIAVSSAEAPHDLLQRADVVVEGPSGVVNWLRGLLG